ncbi:HAD family hydrolase [Kutzneria kofuensis]|uniref:Phosphoglycolate phosphatase n=1 Tax=Kutzneria kofuensis TaxID=103725 RepID=A0A7W9KNL2_9PSEU|nr:HAD family hydrolase [Kutzneria kofuensis]MBB5895856.1 phosphoglycolate phosphatase [Kutzneria kofuensis]
MDTVVLADVDGTLVDSNYHHAVAWFRAFREVGVTVPIWRIHRAIGMGGDQLVEAVAGERVELVHGDDVRAAWAEQVKPLLGEIVPLTGARDLLVEVKRLGCGLVLASSGKPEHVDHYLNLLGARDLADGWTTSEDVDATKPAPDLLGVALHKVPAERALALGDSVWDCEAAGKLGIPTVGLRTGGFGEAELRDAGAVRVYEDPSSLRAELRDVLELV